MSSHLASERSLLPGSENSKLIRMYETLVYEGTAQGNTTQTPVKKRENVLPTKDVVCGIPMVHKLSMNPQNMISMQISLND